MKKIEMVKAVGETIVSLGVGAIITNVITVTTPPSVKLVTKVCIGVGGLVLGGMLTDSATDYVEKKFDDSVNYVKDIMVKTEVVEEIVK